MKKLVIPLLIVLLLSSCKIKPGKEVVYPSSFKKSIASVRHDIETKRYQKAMKQLSNLRREFPETKYVEQIMYYTAIIEYKKGRYKRSKAVLDSIKNAAIFGDEYYFIRGENLYNLKKWKKAFEMYINITSSKYYRRIAYNRIDSLLKKSDNITFMEIVKRYKNINQYRDKEYYIIIKRLYDLKEKDLKNYYIRLMEKKFPESNYISMIESFKTVKVENKTEIEMILPLSGISTTIGQDFLSGFKLATNYNELNIRIIDSHGDPIEMIKGMKSTINRNGSKIVIGPLYTFNSIVASVYCNDRGIPIILPMNEDIRIREIGDNVYQFGKANKEEAETLVEYLKNDGKMRAAIFYMNNPKGRQEETTFEEIFKSAGGNIISKEFFSPNENDYSTQMESLKVAYDSIGYDVIFVNGSPDNLIMAATQLKYYEINARIIGLGDWDEDKVIRLGGTYVDSVIYAKANWEGKDVFKKNVTIEYRRKYHYSPTIASYYGYDTGLLINRIFKQKGNMKEILSDLNGFWGTTGYVSINNNSKSPGVELYIILNNRIMRLKRSDNGKGN